MDDKIRWQLHITHRSAAGGTIHKLDDEHAFSADVSSSGRTGSSTDFPRQGSTHLRLVFWSFVHSDYVMADNPGPPHGNAAGLTHDFAGDGDGDGGRERLQTVLEGKPKPPPDIASLTSILALLGTTNSNGGSATASLSIEDLQRLLSIFSPRELSPRGVTQYSLVEEEEDDDEYLDEDDEGTVYYNWGSASHARPWDRSRGWWPRIAEPQKEGLELLYSGEFGRALHQIRSREDQNNVARKLLSRGMSSRPTPKEDITCVRLTHLPNHPLR